MAQWHRRIAQIQETISPLDYGGGGAVHRLYIEGSSIESSHMYFSEEPTLAAFIDVVPYGSNVYIKYMSVRPEDRGKGLARQLVQAVYNSFPEYDINWGEVHHPGAGHLYNDFRKRYPDRTWGGKVRY
ncbi:MAG: GNAT family N-acetyltransferase [Saprospiraceae bacterium]|nr:GNAT family N-acetyltransferase [Saprospiraceae bacterium]